MEKIDLLHQVYGFWHLPAPTSQKSDDAKELMDKFLEAIPSLKEELNESIWWRNLKLEWFPGYGCVLLLETGPTMMCVGEVVNLKLLALDGWRCSSHLSSSSHSIAQPNDSQFWPIGMVAVEEINQFWDKFEEILNDAKTKHGDSRQSSKVNFGHQKTPAFIEAVVLRALGNESALPSGGFTDVGLHTGGDPRSTVWPLVAKVLYECSKHLKLPKLFEELLIEHDLSNLNSLTSGTPIEERSISQVNMMMKIIQSISEKIIHCSHSNRKQLISKELESKIMKTVKAVVTFEDDYLQRLNQIYQFHSEHLQHRNFIVEMERFTQALSVTFPQHEATSLQTFQQKARNAIFGHLIDPLTATMEDIISWLNNQTIMRQLPALSLHIIHLSMIEKRIMHEFNSFFEKTFTENPRSYVKNLEVMLLKYRELTKKCIQNIHDFGGSDIIQYRSKEALVMWMCAILFKWALESQWPELKEYKIDIEIQYLKHFCFSKPEWWRIAHKIARYIEQHKENPPIFSFKTIHPTFRFAESYGKKDKTIQSIYLQEQREGEMKKANHWKEVEERKKHLQELKSELESLKKRTPLPSTASGLRRRDNEIGQLQNQIASARSNVPKIVEQSLPKDELLAYRMLFFLYMDELLLSFGSACIISLQCLCPLLNDGLNLKFTNLDQLIGFETINSSDSMSNYFAVRKSPFSNVEAKNKIFTPGGQNLPFLTNERNSYSLRNIELFSSPECGMYYPDEDVRQSTLYWYGGAGESSPAMNLIFEKSAADEYFQFHSIPDLVITRKYTHLVKSNMQNQNILIQIGFETVDKTRGNAYIVSNAKQAERDYCSIRAYPLQQFRKLILGLRWLDASNANNLILYQQALYQLGEVKPHLDFKKSFSWKADFFDLGWFFQWLRYLSETVRLYQESPSNLTMLRFLSEMISFTVEWEQDELFSETKSEGSVTIASAFSEQLIKFGEDIELQKDTDSIKEDQEKVSCKQYFYYMNALISLGNCNHLLESDAVDVVYLACKAAILAHDLTISEKEKDHHLRYLGYQTQFLRLPFILPMLRADCDLITKLFKLVVKYASEDLKWKYIQSAAHCFEAFDQARQQLFSLDVLSGMVLVNGNPPSNLPMSILKHPLYLSYFENQNFKTTIMSNGSFRTASPKDSKFYEFTLSTAKQSGGVHCYLKIFEYSEDFETKLELLDVNNPNHKMWSIDLYNKEFLKYSHWYSEVKNFILFRGKTIADKKIYFALNRIDSRAWQNHIVPMHLQQLDIEKLRSKLPELNHQVRIIDEPATALYRCLQKFETCESIEFHSSSDKSKLFIYFTRYELTLEYRNGLWFSLDYSGYWLNECQQCLQTSWFTKYLLLSNAEGHKRLIFAPSDETIEGSCLTLKPFVYDINDRTHIIEASTIESRLYLAYILSKYGSMNHNPATHMSNVEMAMLLLRRAWKNTPFTKEEASMLKKIRTVCEPVSPSLQLLCEYLQRSNQHLIVLHEGKTTEEMIAIHSSHAKGYAVIEKTFELLNYRQQLTDEEQVAFFNHVYLKPEFHFNYGFDYFAALSEKDFLVIKDLINEREKQIDNLKDALQKCLLVHIKPTSKSDFPFSSSKTSMIHQLHHSFLQNSWKISQEKKESDLNQIWEIPALLQSWHKTITDGRSILENLILKYIKTFPPDIDHQPFEMLRAMNYLPVITAFDFLSLAIHPRDLRKFNPYLNEDSIALIHTAIVKWLELCVYENQLARLCHLMSHSEEKNNIAKEIEYLCCREDKYYRETIEWLVFEVEQNIMIRPNQLDMTLSLIHYIENDVALPKGAVHQLNMGEGKTRIIIPMLILYFGKKNKGVTVTRLTILAELLHEAYNYFHKTLTNSTLNCKLFVFPFHRNMPIDIKVLTSIQYQISKCREWGGCVLQAPSYFLSMVLKEKESELDVGNAINTICRSYKYLDIIDECDEVLRSKYELVYACGDVQHLPDASYRFAALKAVFIAMKRLVTISKLLQNQRISMLLSEISSERFPQLQLLPGSSLSEITNLLKKEIANSIFNNLTYEYLWMSKYQHQRELIVEWIWDSCLDGSSLKETLNLEDDEYQYLLALRGFVAFDIVLHCLEKRHRVNYGVDFAAQGKRIAIPFVAADTPSLRSEFANVDCMLVYTFLSYCYTGLSKEQIIEVFEKLLQNPNQSAQQDIYREWFQLNDSSEQHSSIDDIVKIDLTNPSQVSLLDKVYQYNMEVIFFFLTAVVFPVETKQYPHLILASSWDLCDNPYKPPVGFSGTRDNSFTYPLQVEQREVLNRPDLEGTTGSMLKLILEARNSSYIPIDKPPEIPTWQCILQTIERLASSDLVGKLPALIDAGGQITGITYKEFALRLTHILPSVRGVVYFDVALRDWMVIDSNLRCWHLASAPFKEDECFVFYDESRCRGADMKLCKQAIGLITLSSTIGTDKLMQAAGRMRQLSMGQRVMFLGTQEVTQSIDDSCGLTGDGFFSGESLNCGSSTAAAVGQSNSSSLNSQHILQWTINNTIDSITENIQQWSRQGIIFAQTQQRSLEKSVIPISLELKTLFEAPHQTRNLKNYAEDILQTFNGTMNDETTKVIFEKIESCENGTIIVSSTDEECEREMKKIAEAERTIMKEISKQEPVSEMDWNYSLINSAANSSSFSSICKASSGESLQAFLSSVFGKNLTSIIDERIFGTRNFYKTVVCGSNQGLASFLRRADAMLYFPKEERLLLLSEREADQVLEKVWNRNWTGIGASYSSHPQFWNLEIKLRSQDAEMQSMLSALLTLQLFNGVTSFKTGNAGDEEVLQCLCNLLIRDINAFKELIEKILQSRNLYHNFLRSDVEKLLMTRNHRLE